MSSLWRISATPVVPGNSMFRLPITSDVGVRSVLSIGPRSSNSCDGTYRIVDAAALGDLSTLARIARQPAPSAGDVGRGSCRSPCPRWLRRTSAAELRRTPDQRAWAGTGLCANSRGLHTGDDGRAADTSALQFSTWTPTLIGRYVSRACRRCPGSRRKVTSSIRSFLNFLLEQGLIRRDLAAAVPSFARWRLASLPETLRKEEVVRLVRQADVRTPLGRRDHAIVLCLSELGLRASDVAGLECDGIDLAHGVLRLRRRKEREKTALPLPRRLAAALDTYLRDGRPPCVSSVVFVRHCAPVGKPITPMNVCNVVLRLATRAGLRDRVGGTHVLRHSIASRLLSGGATLKQIADLLGHQSMDTTNIYAKVDLGTLSRVALPWLVVKGGGR